LPKCYENDDNLNNIRNETTKQDCLTEDEAWNTYQALEDFIDDFYSDFNAYNCALPCKVISFSFDIDYRHSNSIITRYPNQSVEEGGFQLHYYYKSLKVEEKTETLIYDVGNFLAAAGGNLGLFLGFSCLSVLFELIKFAETYLHKHC
jgi:hypothetical protein